MRESLSQTGTLFTHAREVNGNGEKSLPLREKWAKIGTNFPREDEPVDRQEYRERLAARLRGARAESGLSQKQVEKATGIDTSRLSRIENAERPIELEDLLQLAGLYDVPLGRFLEVLEPLGDPPSATRASSNRRTQAQAA